MVRKNNLKKSVNHNKKKNKQKGGSTDYWKNDDETRHLLLESSFILGNRHQNRGNNVFYNSNEDFDMDEQCFEMVGSNADIMTFEKDFMCFKNNEQRSKMGCSERNKFIFWE